MSCSAVASLFMKCFEEAEVPKGMINMVIGTSQEAKTAAVVHPLTAGIGFTGSTKTGNDIMEKAKAKRSLMELGGNGPVAVSYTHLDVYKRQVSHKTFSWARR